MPGRRAACLALLAVVAPLGLLASPSHAQAPAPAPAPARRVPVVAVCLDQAEQDPALPALLCAHLTPWLQSSERWSPVSVDRALVAQRGDDPIVATLQAREDLEAARAEFDSGSRKKGLQRLEAVADALIALDPWLTDRELLAEALLALMQAQLTASRDKWRPDATATRLFNFVPEWRQSWRQRVRPGPLYDRLERVANRRGDAPGSVEVTCEAPACEIAIDGRLVGVTPRTIPNLASGEHLIRVRRAGFTPRSERVTIIPDETAHLHLKLERAPGFTGYDRLLQQLPDEVGAVRVGPAMKDLRALLVADQLLALRVLPPAEDGLITVELYLYDLRSEQLLGVVDLPQRPDLGPPDPAALIASLLDGLIDAERRQIEAAASTSDDEGPTLLNQWWFWTGIGAAVVLSGATLLYLSLDEDAAAPPTSSPPPLDPNAGTVRLTF